MGVNIMAFCKQFNAATAAYVPGTPLTTKIIAYTDRTADMSLRSPPTAYLLKRAAGVEKGSPTPASHKVGTVGLKHIYEIARIKQTDKHLSHLSLYALCRCIVQTAHSCGIEVRNERAGADNSKHLQ